jgi:hypothetical protein
MSNLSTFKVLCELVADEDDPAKLELLKARMKALLREREAVDQPPTVSVN